MTVSQEILKYRFNGNQAAWCQNFQLLHSFCSCWRMVSLLELHQCCVSRPAEMSSMSFCHGCKVETKYICLICQGTVCNRPECAVFPPYQHICHGTQAVSWSVLQMILESKLYRWFLHKPAMTRVREQNHGKKLRKPQVPRKQQRETV